LLTSLERWLDRVKEFNWEGVALVNVWDVALEASLSIVVRQQTNVLELPAED
jgi:hypothetical protein